MNEDLGFHPPLSESGPNITFDHVAYHWYRVLFKLCLMEEFRGNFLYERMWDADQTQEVNDHVGYRVWDAI